MRAGSFAAIVAVYLTLAIGSLLTLRPWCDEGWFSAPAHSLITHGNMGTEVLEPTASWRSVQLTGIHEYTYWIMPLYPLAQAAWYEVTGFGLLRMRMLSLLWGLAAVVAWYFAIKQLSGDRLIALIAMGLTAIDFQFLWSASAGRMDMMAAALGYAGIAAYLMLRERHFSLAIAASYGLVAAGLLTHPLALTALAGLIFLTAYYDRSSLRWRHAVYAAIPYLIGAAGWGSYILRSPGLFRAQFGGNASDRWAAFAAPLTALRTEITDRYLATFGLASYTSGASRLKIVILICYACGIIGCLATAEIRRRKDYRALLILTAIYFFSLPLLDGFKQVFYLVHIIPMFTALLAVWVSSHLKQWHASAVLVSLVAVQLATTGYRIKQNPYRNSYLEAGRLLKAKGANGQTVMGSAEWVFQLGFDDHLVDDFRLGFRSGKKADLIILDEGRYEPWIANLAWQDPQNYRYIQRLLAEEYRPLDGNGYYKIYARTVR